MTSFPSFHTPRRRKQNCILSVKAHLLLLLTGPTTAAHLVLTSNRTPTIALTQGRREGGRSGTLHEALGGRLFAPEASGWSLDGVLQPGEEGFAGGLVGLLRGSF